MKDRFQKDRFTERLRHAVQLRGGTTSATADRCGMPVATLECYLSGHNLPGTAALARLSSGLDISLDWLVCGVGRAGRPAR